MRYLSRSPALSRNFQPFTISSSARGVSGIVEYIKPAKVCAIANCGSRETARLNSSRAARGLLVEIAARPALYALNASSDEVVASSRGGDGGLKASGERPASDLNRPAIRLSASVTSSL